MLFQDGNYYIGPYDSQTASVWTQYSYTDFTASDFGPSFGPHPNFSSTGGPIEFGFETSNTAPCFVPCAATSSGIDNLSITIFNTQAAAPSPEPNTWVLMLVGFGGLGLALLRRAGKGRRATAIT